MRFLIAALVLSCGLSMAEDFPQNANGIKTLTAEQAAELVAKFDGHLSLDDLTSIDKGVAQELAKFQGYNLTFLGLTSVDKDVLEILKSNPSIRVPKKYRD